MSADDPSRDQRKRERQDRLTTGRLHAAQATAEYEARAKAVDENTMRLKALRLARDQVSTDRASKPDASKRRR